MIINALLVAGLSAGLACSDLPAMDENFESESIDRDALAGLIESNPDCDRALVVQGRLHMKADDVEEGVETFRNVVEQAGDSSMAHTWLGRALLTRASRESSLSDAEEAVEALERAIEIDPMNLDARETLAAFHRSAPWIAGGDMDVAEEQAEFVMQHDRRRGINMTVRNLMADGDEDEAIELMQVSLQEEPDWDELAVQLAIAWHGEEEFEKAHGLLVDYVAQPQPNPMAVYQLGRTSALSGKFIEDGRAAMQRYIAMVETPDAADDEDYDVSASAAYWRLGNIEEHAGDIAAARAAYEKSLALDPENEQAEESLEDLD